MRYVIVAAIALFGIMVKPAIGEFVPTVGDPPVQTVGTGTRSR